MLALGTALGAGASSALYVCGLFFTAAPAQFALGKDLLLAFAGALLLRLGSHERARETTGAEPALSAAVAVAALAAVVLFVEHTLRFPDGAWDAWMIWHLRARWFARAGNAFASAFSPGINFYAHQDSPLLLPGAIAQGFVDSASESIAVPAGVAFAFAATTIGMLLAAASSLAARGWGLLAALALVTTPAFLGWACSQQADVPTGCYVLATSISLLFALRTQKASAFVLAGVAGSMAAWTKNEGALTFAALALSTLAWCASIEGLRGAARRGLQLGLGALPLLALLVHFKLRYAHRNDLVHLNDVADALVRATDWRRWGEVLLVLLRRLVYFQEWALWLAAASAAFFLLRKRLRGTPEGAVSRALLSCVVLWLPMYELQPHGLLWFMRASIDRLLLQIWPSLLLVLALALGPDAERAATS